jgi:hypothetical protein
LWILHLLPQNWLRNCDCRCPCRRLFSNCWFQRRERAIQGSNAQGVDYFRFGNCLSYHGYCRDLGQSNSYCHTLTDSPNIEQFGQRNAYPTSAPLEPGSKLWCANHNSIPPDEWLQLNKLPYRSLVGCLLYLAISTRPDISHAVQQLSQYLDSYSFDHWKAALRLVHYLKGTRDLKLHLRGNCPIILHAFSDSDWANCLDTRQSVGSYVCSLSSGAISWAARKQKVVAASSCEAEYIAAFETAKECIWLCTLLDTIGYCQTSPTTISCDNTVTKTLSEDPLLHSCVKHIKYHFLREHVQSADLCLNYIKTKHNVADMFTKALDVKQFIYLRHFMGLKWPIPCEEELS